MAITKLGSDYTEITGKQLSSASLLRMFDILQDDDENKFMNIFRSYVVDEATLNDMLYFDTYEATHDEFFDGISYKLYGTVGLWWVICLANTIANPFEELEPGQNLKVLSSRFLSQILREIRTVSEY
jgi:hypothetical protein